MKLRCVDSYRSREVYYPKGAVVEVSEGEGAFLLRDAPGCWVVVEEADPLEGAERKSPEAPPVDRAVGGPGAVSARVRKKVAGDDDGK